MHSGVKRLFLYLLWLTCSIRLKTTDQRVTRVGRDFDIFSLLRQQEQGRFSSVRRGKINLQARMRSNDTDAFKTEYFCKYLYTLHVFCMFVALKMFECVYIDFPLYSKLSNADFSNLIFLCGTSIAANQKQTCPCSVIPYKLQNTHFLKTKMTANYKTSWHFKEGSKTAFNTLCFVHYRSLFTFPLSCHILKLT